MPIEVILQLWYFKERVKKVCSSSINPNTCTLVIFVSLKISMNGCLEMQEASNVRQSQISNNFIWNGASIVTKTLKFMDILNMAKMIAILTSFIFLNTCLCKHSTYFLDRGSFPSYSKTWISNTLGVGGTKMGNPHEHTN